MSPSSSKTQTRIWNWAKLENISHYKTGSAAARGGRGAGPSLRQTRTGLPTNKHKQENFANKGLKICTHSQDERWIHFACAACNVCHLARNEWSRERARERTLWLSFAPCASQRDANTQTERVERPWALGPFLLPLIFITAAHTDKHPVRRDECARHPSVCRGDHSALFISQNRHAAHAATTHIPPCLAMLCHIHIIYSQVFHSRLLCVVVDNSARRRRSVSSSYARIQFQSRTSPTRDSRNVPAAGFNYDPGAQSVSGIRNVALVAAAVAACVTRPAGTLAAEVTSLDLIRARSPTRICRHQLFSIMLCAPP